MLFEIMLEVREKTDKDEVAGLIALATEDLRRVYRRAANVDGSAMLETEHAAVSLVAVEGETVVGIVEYCEKEDSCMFEDWRSTRNSVDVASQRI